MMPPAARVRRLATAAAAPLSDLTDALLATRLANHLLTTPHIPPALLPAAPLPLPVRLHVLRHPALPPTSKLSFFLAATPPASPHLAATFPVLLRALATHSPPLLDALLPFALSSPSPDALLPGLLSALLSASRLDAALALLQDAPPDLLPRLAAAAIPSLIASPDPLSAVPAIRRLLPIASHPPHVRATNRLLLALSKENLYDDFCHVFDEMSRRGLPSNLRFYNICIHAFGKWKRLDKSLKLFAATKAASPPLVPDICTYNSVIRVLVIGGRVADALLVFDEMKLAGIHPDVFTYRAVVDGCCKSFRMDDALRMFQEMRGGTGLKGDVVVYNSLLNGLFKAKRLDEACGFFETMVADGIQCSASTHNTVIDGLFKNGRAEAACRLFYELRKKGQLLDGIAYSIMVREFCKEGTGDQVAEAVSLVKEMEDRGFVIDLVTITSLLLGFNKSRRWDLEEKIVKIIRDSSVLPDAIRWKSNMMDALTGPQDRAKDGTSIFPFDGNMNDVMSLLNPAVCTDTNEGTTHNEPKDDWSLSPHLDHLAKHADHSNNSAIFTVHRGQRVEGMGGKTFDADMVNTYMSIFLAKGKLSVACKLFEIFTNLGRKGTSYTYNSLMTSFVKKGYLKQVWAVLHERGGQLCPNDIATYNLIIQGLGQMGKTEVASSIMEQLSKKGVYMDIVMYNTLINQLGKVGKVEEANCLLEQITTRGMKPDLVTFNTLIDINAKAGRLKEADKYLRRMIAEGIAPNHVTETIMIFLDKEIQKKKQQSK
ncbi:pentatricopeptide repeat-containing protein At4g01570-like [Triticum dicoccoides]|uniref:pentatricopeptide repeat-containing protein At4g01570-like n=1 Tax=Triticum dicoccoides TaxID=85692 RepID=UPI0018902CF9|nr:pentatricopeptide repeat-containing protein At4g01570-like [Triticum dicoccoides]XP_037428994.1 pentatricopeptide repeat-containing protein At4g01570-like [Triticum dicoccoides]XP_037428995.1 pentatricopeptide repeat-containing protein At4g01570-like [Triticum dicoccoides]XP_037428996.1 pentatricopeptide repeat-containing protein At4g01570-like [Triticum dicoccoides]